MYTVVVTQAGDPRPGTIHWYRRIRTCAWYWKAIGPGQPRKSLETKINTSVRSDIKNTAIAFIGGKLSPYE